MTIELAASDFRLALAPERGGSILSFGIAGYRQHHQYKGMS